MKKFMAMVIVISLFCALTACDSPSWKQDTDFAHVEITTSTGTAHVDYAFHGKNYVTDANRKEHAIDNPTKIDLADGETATIHFRCDQCGYDEVVEEAVAPYAKVFACECSGTLAEGNMTEYIAVTIGVNASLDGVASTN